MSRNTEIDFVITWVDGGDPAWLREKAAYSGQETSGEAVSVDARDVRYRDHGLLRYWFRGVEQFAPWVRKIHFVTWGHLPAWLDTNHPKLHIVRHEDYIPKEFLPIFNSNAIEMNMHRIEGLSEFFVYFNDDMFLLRPVEDTYFFRNGKPCDLLAFQPVVANRANPVMSHLFLNNALVVCKHFDKRENVRKQLGKYFKIGYPPLFFFYNMLELAFPKYTGFFTVHGPAPFCKQTFQELWEKEEQALLETISHRFRSKDDVTPYLFRDWQKLSGNFYPCNLLKDFAFFALSDDNQKLCRTIKGQKKKIICINDPNREVDFDRIYKELRAAWDAILPERSAFEKADPDDGGAGFPDAFMNVWGDCKDVR